jgi:uncharacterized protein (DUF433 family)
MCVGGIKETAMKLFSRITTDRAIAGGKPSIRGMQVTVGAVLNLMASGQSRREILEAFPLLEAEDLDEALAYAAKQIDGEENGKSESPAPRTPGLHAGAMIPACDFDAALPEEFWTGTP